MRRFRMALFASVLVMIAAGFVSKAGKGPAANIFGLRSWKLTSSADSSAVGAPSGSIIWSADMETGDLSQWSRPDVPGGPNAGGGVFDSGTSKASVDVASPSHSGIHSAKLYINTLSPSEVSTSGVRLFRWLEPESRSELHYSVWYYFPRRYIPNGSPPWWNVFVWKSKRGDASDPFFGRVGQMMAVSQKQQSLKFELLVPLRSEERPTACMSFNYHRDHFGTAWGIADAAGEPAHTACVAFGMDRLAVAMFHTHGRNVATWPTAVRNLLGFPRNDQ